jgi:hypothetical protein
MSEITPLPDSGAIGEVTEHRLRQDPAHLAAHHHPTLTLERQLAGKGVGIEGHPGVVIVGVHAGERPQGVGRGRLTLEAADLQKTLSHERELGQLRPGAQHHGVGANRDGLRDGQGGLGQLIAGLLQRRAELTDGRLRRFTSFTSSTSTCSSRMMEPPRSGSCPALG